MKLLKKKISIILFHLQLKNNLYVLILPTLLQNPFMDNVVSTRGISYTFLKNKVMPLAISNANCIILKSKQDFLFFMQKYKYHYFGFKFKYLFFEAESILSFNYINTASLKGFILKISKIYFYFLRYLSYFTIKFKSC